MDLTDPDSVPQHWVRHKGTCLVGSLLPEALLSGDEMLVDDVVDVRVVGVKELLHLPHLRVVQKQAQMLQKQNHVRHHLKGRPIDFWQTVPVNVAEDFIAKNANGKKLQLCKQIFVILVMNIINGDGYR
jgi:hypothetical protein